MSSSEDGAPETEGSAPPPTPETESEEPETARDLGNDLQQIGKDLDAAGIKPEAVKGFFAEKVQAAMVKQGIKAVEKMQGGKGKYPSLAALWEELSDEGRQAYIKNKTSFWHSVRGAITPTLFKVGGTIYTEGKVRILPQSWLDVEDFDDKEVKTLLALGALECPPSVQAAIDHELSGGLNKLEWLLKVLPFIAPEAAPELEGVAKVLDYGVHGVKFLEEQLPAVRAEVKRRKMEVVAEVSQEHEAVAKDVNPPLDLKAAA